MLRQVCAVASFAFALAAQTVGAAGSAPQWGPQSTPAAAAAAFADLPEIDGPPPPVAPDMVRRDEKGNATIRATRIEHPLQLDGHLNDEAYQRVPAIGGFIQQLPREGQPATEPTEVWIFFDDDTLYVAGHCIETAPERAVASELRRDHNNIFQTDNITVVFDTFYDRRNGFFFQTNQLSAVRDQAISENEQLVAWNTVWDVRSARVEDGWTSSMG